MKLSILICVYNTDHEYLRECLASVADSALADYEICMVDDGSATDYSDLAKEFGVRLQKTENRGILRARTAAVRMATGDYAAFLDSDDTVSAFYHQPMLETAERTGADIVLNDWAFHTERTRYFCTRDTTIATDFDVTGGDCLRRFFQSEGREHSYYVLWNKIYRRTLLLDAVDELERQGVTEERLSYAEDALINFFAFRNAKRVCNLHTGYYFYRQHNDQTVKVVSEERLRSQILAMGRVLGLMRENLPDTSLSPALDGWQSMMSRTHYSYAKPEKYRELYPLIQKTYGVEKLRRSTGTDQAPYVKTTLLPENFKEIDQALLALAKTPPEQSPIPLAYDAKNAYVGRVLAWLESSRGIKTVRAKDAKTAIPPTRITTVTKLLHNRVIYRTGMILFPKGSKIRAFLKRLI